MNKLILFLSAFLLIPIILKAQEPESFSISSSLEPNQSYYIFADVANIREKASTTSEIQDKLLSGDEITFLRYEKDSIYSQNGLMANWIKISYKKDDQIKEGYTWLLNISRIQLRRDDVRFVFGAVKTSSSEKIKYELKAIRDKKIISRIEFDNPQISLVSANIIDNIGLADTQKIIKLYFSGEACAIPSIEYFFAWNGKDLVYIDNTFSVGDADIYSYSENLIFPPYSDYTNSNVVLKLITEEHYSNESDNDITEPIRKYKTKLYVWNGRKLVLQDQNWEDESDTYK